MDIDIRSIEPGDRLTGLSLGQEYLPLKTFLQRKAKHFHSQGFALTYGAFNKQNKKIIGYITLLCGEVVAEQDHPIIEDVEYNYSTYPAVKIARLAVDQSVRKQKLGRTLVDLSLGICKENICPYVGCRFAMVDAKKTAVKFYEKCGFTFLDTPENHLRDSPVMFVDLRKA